MARYAEGRPNRISSYPLFAVVSLLVVLSSLPFLPRAASQNDQQVPTCEQAEAGARQDARDRAIGKDIASPYAIEKFRPSLEMKEKMDFLLTPVFLVQEAISDGVVLVYPEE